MNSLETHSIGKSFGEGECGMITSDLWDKIHQYVQSKITLEQLEDWFAPRWPDLLDHPGTPDAKVAGLVELGLAEMNDHILTEDEFKASLRAELPSVKSVWTANHAVAQQSEESGSANTMAGPAVYMPTRVALTQV